MEKNLKVVLWSQFLDPVDNSLSGSVTGISYNSSAISFEIASFLSADSVSVTFEATVKSSIQPLANLYFAVLVTGKDAGNANNYHYGPAPSLPTLYAVFPTVSLTRTSYSCKYHWCVLSLTFVD